MGSEILKQNAPLRKQLFAVADDGVQEVHKTSHKKGQANLVVGMLG